MSAERPEPGIPEIPEKLPRWHRRPQVITVEGELAAGKDTLCATLCEAYGFRYLDVSGIGRGLAAATLREGVDLENETAVGRFYAEADVDFAMEGSEASVCVNGADVTADLKTPETYDTSARLIRYPFAPLRVGEIARDFIRPGNVVVNGRRLTNDIWPGAELQLFLIGDFEVRLERRFRELYKANPATTRKAVADAMRRREAEEAAAGTGTASTSSLIIDTTALAPDGVASTVVESHNRKIRFTTK
ncbi:MAG: (d)CMP kinase [Patescibacteria group bacterium]